MVMRLRSKTTGLSEQNGWSESKKKAGAPCLIDDVERNMCRSSRKSRLQHLNKQQPQTVTPSRGALPLYAPRGFHKASTLMYNITQAQKCRKSQAFHSGLRKKQNKKKSEKGATDHGPNLQIATRCLNSASLKTAQQPSGCAHNSKVSTFISIIMRRSFIFFINEITRDPDWGTSHLVRVDEEARHGSKLAVMMLC